MSLTQQKKIIKIALLEKKIKDAYIYYYNEFLFVLPFSKISYLQGIHKTQLKRPL